MPTQRLVLVVESIDWMPNDGDAAVVDVVAVADAVATWSLAKPTQGEDGMEAPHAGSRHHEQSIGQAACPLASVPVSRPLATGCKKAS